MANISGLLNAVRERAIAAENATQRPGITNSLSGRYYLAKSQKDVQPLHHALKAAMCHIAYGLAVGGLTEYERGYDAALRDIRNTIGSQLTGGPR